MTTISNQLSSGIYGYSVPAAGGAAAPAQPATTDVPASSTYTASGAASAPLTYTAAGLLGSSQTTHVTPQAARAAIAAAQDAVTQAQGALMSSGSSTTTQSTDIFGAPTNNSSSLTAAPPAPPASTPTTVQTAQNAYLSTQNIVTQSQKSLTA